MLLAAQLRLTAADELPPLNETATSAQLAGCFYDRPWFDGWPWWHGAIVIQPPPVYIGRPDAGPTRRTARASITAGDQARRASLLLTRGARP